MDKVLLSQHLEIYKQELEVNVLPFWTQRALDWDFGGYFTCFSNDGKKLISTDKYVWSQGRLVWVFSELAELYNDEKYLTYARLGVHFLTKHARLPSGNCAFLLAQDGTSKEPNVGGGYDTSIYADCFVVLGLARYAAVTKDHDVLQYTFALYESIVSRLANSYRTEPYPIPAGYKAHGIFMIVLNTSQELKYCLEAFADDRHEAINKQCNRFMTEIFSTFYKSDGLIYEMVNPTIAQDDSLLGRYVNPGHTLEDMWFIMHQAQTDDNQTYVQMAADVIERIYEVGWDQEYGGLVTFADNQGGPPKGTTDKFADHPMVQKIQADWSHKLWWPHSEALYTTLLGYHLTKRPQLWALYNKTKDYTLATFPNPDTEVGEWIQIRDRQGNPIETVVALPVKDPFHIARNLILLIRLLEQMIAEKS